MKDGGPDIAVDRDKATEHTVDFLKGLARNTSSGNHSDSRDQQRFSGCSFSCRCKFVATWANHSRWIIQERLFPRPSAPRNGGPVFGTAILPLGIPVWKHDLLWRTDAIAKTVC